MQPRFTYTNIGSKTSLTLFLLQKEAALRLDCLNDSHLLRKTVGEKSFAKEKRRCALTPRGVHFLKKMEQKLLLGDSANIVWSKNFYQVGQCELRAEQSL